MRARYFARAQGRPFSLLYGVVLYDQVAHHSVMSVCTWIVLIATAFVIHQPAWASCCWRPSLVALAGLVVWSVWSGRARHGEENPIVRFLARRAERDRGEAAAPVRPRARGGRRLRAAARGEPAALPGGRHRRPLLPRQRRRPVGDVPGDRRAGGAVRRPGRDDPGDRRRHPLRLARRRRHDGNRYDGLLQASRRGRGDGGGGHPALSGAPLRRRAGGRPAGPGAARMARGRRDALCGRKPHDPNPRPPAASATRSFRSPGSAST